MSDRVDFDGYFCERAGDTITFGWRWENGKKDIVYLKVALLPKEKLAIDTEWKKAVGARRRARDEWIAFLRRHLKTLGPLAGAALPGYLRSDEDRMEYLWQIARGYVRVPGLGHKGRKVLQQVLPRGDYEDEP